MSIGPVLFSRLNNATSAGNRIYPLLLPQSPTYPAVTYQQIASTKTPAMGTDAALTRIRVQVNVWGRTYAEARTLALEVSERLARFKGTVGNSTIHDVLQANEYEGYESGAESRRVIQDYTVFLTTNA